MASTQTVLPYVSAVRLPMVLGMLPLNELLERMSDLRCRRVTTSHSTFKFRNVDLNLKLSAQRHGVRACVEMRIKPTHCSLVRLSMVLGILPLSLFRWKYRCL